MQEQEQEDEETLNAKTKILSNGAVYDLETHRIVANPGGGTHAITSERASEFAQARRERKREALIAGALRGAKGVLKREPAHELEWVEVLGEANLRRAVDPRNAKGVDASRFLLQESGLSERQVQEDASNDDGRVILRAIADRIRAALAAGDTYAQSDLGES